MGTCEMNEGNKITWSQVKGNKVTYGNRDQVANILPIHLIINLKNNPTKLRRTREFSQGNRGTSNPTNNPQF